MHDCYEHDGFGKVRAERIKLTLVERGKSPTASLAVVATEPSDAPVALVACVGDVLTHEILRPLGANGPMVVTVFAATVRRTSPAP